MPKKTIERHGVTRRYADAVVHDSTIYLVEVPTTLDADISGQTKELLASVESSLRRVGSDKTRLLQVTIHLKDMADYSAMNAIWDEWLPAGAAPSRACVESRLADPGFRVEMIVIAAR